MPGEILEHEAHAVGQVSAHDAALYRLEEASRRVSLVIPGHGAAAEGPEVAERLAADRWYIDALRQGVEPNDARLAQDWLAGPHQSNQEQSAWAPRSRRRNASRW